MKKQLPKPSAEAKALSLFLMAHKKKSKVNKERSVRINRLWNMVINGELSMDDYLEKVGSMVRLLGGYSAVVEKTVKHYINKTGEWSLKGDDKFCIDAQEVADRILNK